MHSNVSLARRSIENIRKDFEAFDLLVSAGGFLLPNKWSAPLGHHRRSAWSIAASFAALVATSLLASSVLLAGSAI